MFSKFLTVLALTFSFSTFASDFKTTDNLTYLVTAKTTHNFEKCQQSICKISAVHGNGECEVLSSIGIVVANLSSVGVTKVAKLKCVLAVEEDGVVHANPRLGRGNH